MQDKPTRTQSRVGRRFRIIRMTARHATGAAIVKVDEKEFASYITAKAALVREFGTEHWPLTVAITETDDRAKWQERFAAVAMVNEGGDAGLIVARRNNASLQRLVKAQPQGRPVTVANLMPVATVRTVLQLSESPDLATLEGRHLAQLLGHPKFPAHKVARLSQTDDFPLRYTFHPALARYRSRDLYRDAELLPLKGFYAVEDEDGGRTPVARTKMWERYGNAICPLGYHAMKAQPDGVVWLLRFLRSADALDSGPTHATIHLLYDRAPRMTGGPVVYDSL